MKEKGRPRKYDDPVMITLYFDKSDLNLINDFCKKNNIVRSRLIISSTLEKINK